ncbi:YopX family protein [Leptotrichia wadei]|uniref:YopX protein domain-containing protein n=1 Tax=Leptotrichia wadei TaxID=157687 RepID=A0A510KDK0_9FUSO|nr:YopX family protein [Leptotrichia wadei]BBM49752.1 hypothetical protein JMUB3934_1048 [Leptotrichia wadei]
MRKIKFRAWDKENEKMMKVSSLHLENKEISVKENGTFHLFRMQDLMQYTGVKDKNGKEIYEGDIVLIKLDETSTWYKTVVKFKKGAFIASLIDREDYIYIFNRGFDSNDFEIIGNIYKNKNLLEENN